MSFFNILIVALVAALPLSTIAMRELQRRVQPVRLELARRGEAMLKRTDVPEAAKDDIRYMLDTTFGMRGMLLLTLLAAPIAAVGVVFSSSMRADLAESMKLAQGDPEYRELGGLHTSIMFANHPILVPIAAVWVAIWFKPALFLSRLRDRKTPDLVDGGAIIRLVEQRYPHVDRGSALAA